MARYRTQTMAAALSVWAVMGARADTASGARPAAVSVNTVLRDLPDNTWVHLKTDGKPFKRNYSGMTFDTDRGLVVMWGGGHGSHPGNEVEVFDPSANTWRAEYPMTMPPWPTRWMGGSPGTDTRGFPCAWHTYDDLVYDPVHREVLWFKSGGRQVWAYDAVTKRWRLKHPRGPTGMLAAVSAYDTDRNVAVICSKGTYVYDPAKNTFKRGAQGPNPYNDAMCYDPVSKRCILFGDVGTWTYDTAADTWEKMSPTVEPPFRGAHGLVFDTANGVAILFGGTWKGKTRNDTWVYDLKTNTWTEMKPAVVPPWKSPAIYATFVYDPARNVAITAWADTWRGRCETWAYRYKRRPGEPDLHRPSGKTETTPRILSLTVASEPEVPPVRKEPADVKSLRGTWTRLNPDDPPKAPTRRWLSGAVYDSVNDRVLSFGGGTSNYSARPGSVVDLFDPAAKTWTRDHDPRARGRRAAPPVQLTYARLAFDTRKGVMIYAALGGHPDLRQTWAYDAKTRAWSRLNPKTQPDLVENCAAVYHEAARLTIAFGGTYENGGPATWAFDSATNEWRDLKPAHSPSVRIWHAMAYDAKRQVVVLFGGWSGTDDLADTWEFDVKANDWRRVACAQSPPSRCGHGMTYDAKAGRVLLFGGNRGALRDRTEAERMFRRSSYWYGRNLNDTWAYDPAARTWRPVETDARPPAYTVFGGFVHDRTRGQSILICPAPFRRKRTDTASTWALRLE